MADLSLLYSGKTYFLLIIDGVSTVIEEPINWGNILIELLRDAVYYGLAYEFIGGDAELTFKWLDGGGELLKARFDADRGDAKAQMEFGILQGNVREQQFIGNINFNDYSAGEEGVTVTVERLAFESLIRTRFETKVSLSDLVDLDGNVIPAFQAQQVLLHSKEIAKASRVESATGASYLIDPNVAGTPANQTYSSVKYLTPDGTVIKSSEVTETSALPIGVVNDSPTVASNYQLAVAEDGPLHIDFSYHGYANIENNGSNPTSVDFVPYFMVVRGGAVITELYQYQYKQTVNNFYGDSIGINTSFDFDAKINDQFYIGIRLSTTNTSSTFKGISVNLDSFIAFKQLTIAPTSLVLGYRIIDVLNRLVYACTGLPNRVISRIYQSGGAAEKFIITNGFAIRNFIIDGNYASKPVQVSMKTLVDALQVAHNVGMGYTTDSDGNDLLAIDPCENYFAGDNDDDDVVLEFTEVQDDYKETQNKAGVYNQLAFGYNKFPDSTSNTLDEMNTNQEWQTPIQTYKAKLSRLTDVITSGFAIEEIRRDQFAAAPSTSLPNDDEIFLIAYTEKVEYPNVSFQIFPGDSSITFSKPLGMVQYDSFIIAGATINTGSLFVEKRKFDVGEQYYITPGSAAAETGVGTIKITPIAANGVSGLLFAERNQFFTLSNVISPGTVYNVRVTPKHCLYNWSPFVNSFLTAKSDGDFIRNTASKNNGDFTSQFLPGADGQFRAGGLQLTEKSDVALSDYGGRFAIHTNVLQDFSAQMPFYQVAALRDGLRNTMGQRRRRVVVPDRAGKKWLSVLTSLKYNPTTQTATVQTIIVRPY